MKIWQVILYAVLGGLCEVLPVSFHGHALIVQNAFGFASLRSSDGLFIRAAIFLGVALGIFVSYRAELSRSAREVRKMLRPRRRERVNPALRRSVVLGLVALMPMLLSFLFLHTAESVRRLPVVACMFALNGLLIYLATREASGTRAEKGMLLSDAILMGIARMISVFSGLSPLSSGLCVGRVGGLSNDYCLRFSYSLSAVYAAFGFLIFFVRGIVAGAAFSLLSFLLGALVSALCARAAIAYFRYLMHRDKLRFFAFYNFDAALLVLILALINS